jgi:hypothetical protein
MRFLADENFPGAAVIALKGSGHDVLELCTAGAKWHSRRRHVRCRMNYDRQVCMIPRAACVKSFGCRPIADECRGGWTWPAFESEGRKGGARYGH